MERIFGLDGLDRDPRAVVTVGTFDGVHLGHQALLRYVVERARRRQGVSVAVTFDPHPREVVHGESVPLLSTVAERAEACERLGIDRFVVVPFTEAFSRLSGAAFVEQVLVDRIGLREIVIGYDHAFGRGREGDAHLLEQLGRAHGFEVDVIPAQIVSQHVVSSTEIRTLLVEAGDVAGAARLLGRPYELTGSVVHGEARGRIIGFPTANLSVDHPRKVVPRRGVYAVRAGVAGEQDVFGGMMNIGMRPTFDGDVLRLEVHLFDVDRDLYDTHLRVEFVERVREERRFDGVAALVEQLSRDRTRCKAILEGVS